MPNLTCNFIKSMARKCFQTKTDHQIVAFGKMHYGILEYIWIFKRASWVYMYVVGGENVAGERRSASPVHRTRSPRPVHAPDAAALAGDPDPTRDADADVDAHCEHECDHERRVEHTDTESDAVALERLTSGTHGQQTRLSLHTPFCTLPDTCY